MLFCFCATYFQSYVASGKNYEAPGLVEMSEDSLERNPYFGQGELVASSSDSCPSSCVVPYFVGRLN
jgi:hypothetical protein